MAPSSNILEVFMRILRVLECPVCYEWVSSPIYGCSAGHILCSKCIPALRECPTCRSPIRFTSPRVRSLEDIAEVMLYPCRHEGCTELLAQRDLTRHEETCRNAAASGGAALAASLKHSNLLNSLLAHMEEHIAPFLVTSKNTADKGTQTEESNNDSQGNVMSGSFFISGVIKPITSLCSTNADHNASNLNQVCGVFSTLNEIADNNRGTDLNSELLQKSLSKIMQSLSSMDLSPTSSGRKEVGNPSTKNAVTNSVSDCISKNCVTSVHSKFMKKTSERDSFKRQILVPSRITATSDKVSKSDGIFFTKGTSSGNVAVSRSRGDSSSQDGARSSSVSELRQTEDAFAPKPRGGSSNQNNAGTSTYSTLRQTCDDITSPSRGDSSSQNGARSSSVSALRQTSDAVAPEPGEGSSSKDSAGTSSLSALRQTCDDIAFLSRGDSSSEDGAGSASPSELRQTSDAVTPEQRESSSNQNSAGTSTYSTLRQTCDDITSPSRGDSSSRNGAGSSSVSALRQTSDAVAPEPGEGSSSQDSAGTSSLSALRQTCNDIASPPRGDSSSEDGAGSSSSSELCQTSDTVAPESRGGSSNQNSAGILSYSALRQKGDDIASLLLYMEGGSSQDCAGSSSVSALRQTSDAAAPEPREGSSSQDCAGTSASRLTPTDIALLSRGDSSSQDGAGSSSAPALRQTIDAAAPEPTEGCSNQDGAGTSFLPADLLTGDSTTAPQPRESQSSSQNVASSPSLFQFKKRNYFSSPSPPVAFTIGTNPKSPQSEIRTPRMRDRKYTSIRNSSLRSSRPISFSPESPLSDGFNFPSSSNANLSPLSLPLNSVPAKKSPVKRLFSFGDVSFDSSPDVLN